MKFSKKTGKELIIEILLLFIIIFTVVLLWRNNVILFAILFVECAITITLWKQQYDIMYFLFGAIIGPVMEMISIHFGIWAYTNPTFLGIPVWLPVLWGFAAIVLSRIARTIKRMRST